MSKPNQRRTLSNSISKEQRRRFNKYANEAKFIETEFQEIGSSGVHIRTLRYGGWEVVVTTFPDWDIVIKWIRETFGPEGTCKNHRWRILYGKSEINTHLKFRDERDVSLLIMRWS